MKTGTRLLAAVLLPLLTIVLSTGCNKNDGGAPSLGTMPDHFSQRVMMEELTGEWCGSCPSGEAVIEQLKHQYGDSLVVISIHDQDFLDISSYNPVLNAFAQYNFGFPCAAIGRLKEPSGSAFWYSYAEWTSSVQNQLTKDHKTGIALVSSVDGDSAVLEVHIGFHATNAYDMRVNVFLVENNIASQQQTGAGSSYVHQQVLRAIVTPSLGDPFSMATEKEIIKKYKVSIRGYNAANLVFATSVEKWSSDRTDREVFNARQVKLGDNAKWQ